ncbi:hypothetical protein [Citrobacter amalonaticus]
MTLKVPACRERNSLQLNAECSDLNLNNRTIYFSATKFTIMR